MLSKKCSPADRSEYLKSILFTTFLTFFLFAVFLVFPYPNGHCAQVSLSWDPNSEPDLAGYEIYYGTASGNYQWNIDAGNVTTYTLNSLDPGVTYYFAATAYNTSGIESGYSNEVVYSPPACTYSISPSSASFSATGGTGSVLVTTQAGCNWETSAAPSWVTVNSGFGTGNGTMSYTLSSNTGATRISSLTVAGNVFTVTQNGPTTYTLSASAGTGGIISPSGAVSVQSGANQTFSITPASGYAVSGVVVDGVSQGAITAYTFSTVTANHTIAASFSPLNYTLSVTKSGTGSGTVSSNPTGTSFSAGTQVTLTASPDANSMFTGWSGACSGTVTVCQVTMNSNVSVSATFTLKTYTITASAGNGGTISPSGAVSVQPGANQTFSITPASGYAVSGVFVDGVSLGAITSYTFSMVGGNHTISATFSAITSSYTLSTSTTGTGKGTVSSSPTGTSFLAGTQITLTASPDANSMFAGWSGACSGTVATCQVTMNSNVSVIATFSSAAISAPTVATGIATLIPSSSSATLNGTVDPNGLPTSYVFQWGRTTAYGNTSVVTSAGSGSVNAAASAIISDLRSYTTYHYRLVATNSAGTTYGADKSFKTKFTGIRK